MAQLDLNTPVTTLGGVDTTLAEHAGKVLLIVNTASKCGFTPQYAGLDALHQELKDQGVAVLGFPCNQFGSQEPGTADDIQSFCQLNYGVSFPMYAKIDVNGDQTHPLYEQLKAGAPGLLGSKSIKWNFTKFLVDQQGNIVRRYGSRTEPAAIAKDVKKLIGA